ncbi:hypothetical protein BC939DRAFT_433807 [Gamsiella multidivaricata]|uniref:uncharacterized protein n=1 Tax=Gamsiella multidivaricata TaxID=101098 RepID=UPI002220D776|nr:uncharacterized protein BC939DRAFT_433807 [Gamsiella multidivaricata]KAG0358072.1 hypothetical protein BGZ54_010603 [Gamsiella multidivaricata]KAI7832597.1 hypothetical protein BC939DRAFT_433807 [Gamsiella multidivaricata]
MTASTKLYLTLALALAVLATTPGSQAAVADAAPAPVAQTEVFDYTVYQSPPIWQEVSAYEDQEIPINYRPGGARGGDIGRRRRRRRSASMAKRAVIYDKDAHLSLDQDFGDLGLVNAQVETTIQSSIDLKKRLVKRAEDYEGTQDGDDEQNEEGDEHDEEVEEENGASFDGETNSEESQEETNDGNEIGGQGNEDENEEDEDEEDEDEDNFESIDENEERRLDNEAGLQDWIEEMKSEEYFDLAGHPDGNGFDGAQEQHEQSFDYEQEVSSSYTESEGEDEPSPSEEEVFAASWHH